MLYLISVQFIKTAITSEKLNVENCHWQQPCTEFNSVVAQNPGVNFRWLQITVDKQWNLCLTTGKFYSHPLLVTTFYGTNVTFCLKIIPWFTATCPLRSRPIGTKWWPQNTSSTVFGTIEVAAQVPKRNQNLSPKLICGKGIQPDPRNPTQKHGRVSCQQSVSRW